MMISLHKLIVKECQLSEIRGFVEQHHYSNGVRGVTPTYCFRVDHDNQLVGAAIFGVPAMRETIRKYSEDGKVNMTELRRLCFLDECPKNSESKSLGMMFRHLRNSPEVVSKWARLFIGSRLEHLSGYATSQASDQLACIIPRNGATRIQVSTD